MKTIRTKKDVEELIKRLVENGASISIWDEKESCCSISNIVENGNCRYYVDYHEDLTGKDWTQFQYYSELVKILWDNRKHINRTGQLQYI